MAQIILNLAFMHKELTSTERGFFYCAFEKVIQARVNSWRVVKAIEVKEARAPAHRLEMIRSFKLEVIIC